MITGGDVYRRMRQEIESLEDKRRIAAAHVQHHAEALEGIRAVRHEKFLELAKVYLPELDAATIAALKEEQEDIGRIFRVQQEKRVSLTNLLKSVDAQQQMLAGKMARVTAQLEKECAQRDEVTQKVNATLAEHTEFQRATAEAKGLDATLQQGIAALNSARERTHAATDIYFADPLFNYLYQRKFGTDEYQGGVFAFCDRWVARVADYAHVQRKHEFVLQEFAAAFRAVESLQAQQTGMQVILQSIADEVAQAHGLPAVLARIDSMLQTRSVLAGDIAHADAEHVKYVETMADAESETGSYHKQALGTLQDKLQQVPMEELGRRIQATASKRDDEIYNAILTLNYNEHAEFGEGRAARNEEHRFAQLVQGWNVIKNRYTGHDFESNRSYFTEGFDFEGNVLNYNAVRISYDQLWSHIQEHQRFRPVPRVTVPAPTVSFPTYHRPTTSIPSYKPSTGMHSGSRSISTGGFRSGKRGF